MCYKTAVLESKSRTGKRQTMKMVDLKEDNELKSVLARFE